MASAEANSDPGDKLVEYVLDDLYAFKYACTKKNAPKTLCRTIIKYRKQLEDLGKAELQDLVEEILLTKFSQQFPEIYEQTMQNLDSIIENQMKRLEEMKEPTKTYSDKESTMIVFNEDLKEEYKNHVPASIVEHYAESLYSIGEWYDTTDKKGVPEEEKAGLRKYFKKFIAKVAENKIAPFSAVEYKMEARDIWIKLIDAIDFSINKFTNKESEYWINHINSLEKIASKYEEEKKSSIESRKTKYDKQHDRILLFNDSIAFLATLADTFDDGQSMFFSSSLFLVISGFYNAEGLCKDFSYNALVRSSARNVINGFGEYLTAIGSTLKSYIDFDKYIIFEAVLGEYLHSFRPPSAQLKFRYPEIIKCDTASIPSCARYKKEIFASACESVLIDLTPNRHSTSVIICIAGFLCDDEEKSPYWENLLNALKEPKIYAVNWKGENIFSLLGSVLAPKVVKIPLGFILGIFAGAVFALHQSFKIAGDTATRFDDAYNKAKCVGKLLAHVITTWDPLKGKSISLLGHSLGTVVEFGCIKELAKITEADPRMLCIDNLLLLGSAQLLKNISMSKWQKRLDVVTGKISNCRCDKDYALPLEKFVKSGRTPIGMMKVEFEEDKDVNVIKECKKNCVEDYDLTGIVNGHTYYRGPMKAIVQKTEFN